MPPMDQAYSALLEDLAARGLLDETLVVWMGEFGRTPQHQRRRGGRDHWGQCSPWPWPAAASAAARSTVPPTATAAIRATAA